MNRKQRKAKRLRARQHTQAARKDAKYWRDFQTRTGVDMQQAFKDLDSIGAQIEATNRLLDPPVPEKKCRQAWALLTHLFWRFGQFLKAIFGNRTLQN